MVSRALLAAVAAFPVLASAQCGANNPDATVNQDAGIYTTVKGNQDLYTGKSYFQAIQAGLDALDKGERLSVLAEGDIGGKVIKLDSGKTFEGCAPIKASGSIALESVDTTDVKIPYLELTGSATAGARFSGVTGLSLGEVSISVGEVALIVEKSTKDVTIDHITTSGSSHGLYFKSQSSDIEIGYVDLSNHNVSPLTLENVYNLNLHDGNVTKEGKVIVDSKDEFPRTRDVHLSFEHEDGFAEETPCEGIRSENLVVDNRGGNMFYCLNFPVDS